MELFNKNLVTLILNAMPKPKGQKNTKNKAKHSKLMAKKLNKKKKEELLRKQRLKEIVKVSKAQKEDI